MSMNGSLLLLYYKRREAAVSFFLKWEAIVYEKMLEEQSDVLENN